MGLVRQATFFDKGSLLRQTSFLESIYASTTTRTFVTFILLSVHAALAQWPTSINSAITFNSLSMNSAFSDLEGGVWLIGNSQGELVVRRITNEGYEAFPGGVSLGGLYDWQSAEDVNVSSDSCLIVSIAYYEIIAGGYYPKTYGYLQKIDRDGNKLWPEGGVPLSTAASSNTQTGDGGLAMIGSDLDGGVFASWLDFRHNTFNPAIYSQHVNASGEIQWAEGGNLIHEQNFMEWVYVYSTPDSQFVTGGWSNGTTFYFDVDADGNNQGRIEHFDDYRGNLYFIDENNDFYYSQVLDGNLNLHKISLDGYRYWGEDGVLITPMTVPVYNRDILLDSNNGVIFGYNWRHNEHQYTIEGAYVQWFSSDGTARFEEPLKLSDSEAPFSVIQGDDDHIIFVEKILDVDNQIQIRSQRVNSSGEYSWADSLIIHQQSGSLAFLDPLENVKASDGGQIVAFSNGYTTFIKAQNQNGEIGPPVTSISSEQRQQSNESASCIIYPNPSNHNVTVSIRPGNLANISLRVLNLKGQIVQESTIITTGQLDNTLEHSINASRLPSGLYFIQIHQNSVLVLQEKFTILK